MFINSGAWAVKIASRRERDEAKGRYGGVVCRGIPMIHIAEVRMRGDSIILTKIFADFLSIEKVRACPA